MKPTLNRHEVEPADRTLDALLEPLEVRGELANTLVIVTADKGTSLPRAKANVYDRGVHVPLAIIWPARVPSSRDFRLTDVHGRVVDEIVA